MALGKWFKKKDDATAADAEREPSDARDSADAAETLPAEADESAPKGFGARLKAGLFKTKKVLRRAFAFGRKLDEDALEEIEQSLIEADFGPKLAMELVDALRDSYLDKEFDENEVLPFLKRQLLEKLGEPRDIRWSPDGPTVILVTGVNGTGKTTSIGKLANQFKKDGKTVVLAAGDTFRAAAVEQLRLWADERIGCEIVAGAQDADPASVVHDALSKVDEIDADVLIIDTAGRLHTQEHLMRELEKIRRVITKRMENAPHEVLQVIDSTTGQNAIRQTEAFRACVEVTGLVLTKLDGTARGGVIFPILDALRLPVLYVGVGEGVEDLQKFDAGRFVDALFDDAETDG